MFEDVHLHQAERLLQSCRERKLKLTAAESCTGGLLMALLTSIPGASDVVERGYITYANEAKTEMIDVAAGLIEHFGAVSEPVAKGMAEGALWHSRADVAVAITGVAGPDGGTGDKPVGLVHIAAVRLEKEAIQRKCQFQGDRNAIRIAAVVEAMNLLEEIVL